MLKIEAEGRRAIIKEGSSAKARSLSAYCYWFGPAIMHYDKSNISSDFWQVLLWIIIRYLFSDVQYLIGNFICFQVSAFVRIMLSKSLTQVEYMLRMRVYYKIIVVYNLQQNIIKINMGNTGTEMLCKKALL